MHLLLIMCFILEATPPQAKKLKDYFPEVGKVVKPVKKRQTLLDKLKSNEFTTDENLEVIRACDKNANDDYVKTFNDEVKHEVEAIRRRKAAGQDPHDHSLDSPSKLNPYVKRTRVVKNKKPPPPSPSVLNPKIKRK